MTILKSIPYVLDSYDEKKKIIVLDLEKDSAHKEQGVKFLFKNSPISFWRFQEGTLVVPVAIATNAIIMLIW